MKIAIIGMSHIGALKRAYMLRKAVPAKGARFTFVQMGRLEFRMKAGKFSPQDLAPSDRETLARDIADATRDAQLAVLCLRGNIFHIAGMIPRPGKPATRQASGDAGEIRNMLADDSAIDGNWFAFLSRHARTRMAAIPSPPPVESEEWIRAHPGRFAEKIRLRGLNPPELRLAFWQTYCRMLRERADAHGIAFLDLPREPISDTGFLKEAFASDEPTHANPAYGELLLNYIASIAKSGTAQARPAPTRVDARKHPYSDLPERAFWKQAVAQVPMKEFDPMGEVPFRISRTSRVATAGSCFAQHISKRIRAAGFQFLVTETPAAATDEGQARGFYDFSARYGNLYTARQLVQLFDRAHGSFTPADSAWSRPEGGYCDPFRPQIEPDGFASVEELRADRERHLAAVREMFRTLDVFVFTLGLTECWVSKADGAAFPVAPGVAGGEFDPQRYGFVNFGVNEVAADLQAFIGKLRGVNPGAKLLLTVSPVPLVATYEASHVLVSTTYSKSVLRVAAEMVCRQNQGACYFPSYEIITGSYNRGRYFGPDLRSVTEEGVDHVMAVFMRHMTEGGAALAGAEAADDAEEQEMIALAEAACDEELLERK